MGWGREGEREQSSVEGCGIKGDDFLGRFWRGLPERGAQVVKLQLSTNAPDMWPHRPRPRYVLRNAVASVPPCAANFRIHVHVQIQPPSGRADPLHAVSFFFNHLSEPPWSLS